MTILIKHYIEQMYYRDNRHTFLVNDESSFQRQIPGQQSVQLLSAADFPQASRAQLSVAPQVGRRQSAGRVGTSTIPASGEC